MNAGDKRNRERKPWLGGWEDEAAAIFRGFSGPLLRKKTQESCGPWGACLDLGKPWLGLVKSGAEARVERRKQQERATCTAHDILIKEKQADPVRKEKEKEVSELGLGRRCKRKGWLGKERDEGESDWACRDWAVLLYWGPLLFFLSSFLDPILEESIYFFKIFKSYKINKSTLKF